MPPIGIPDEDRQSAQPQYLTLLILAVLIVGFSVASTMLVMRAFESGETAAPAPSCPAMPECAEGTIVDPQAYVAAFESKLGTLKKVENNIFTLTKKSTAVMAKEEKSVKLRVYVTWDRVEGMDENTLWATITTIKFADGKDPVVAHLETQMHATELFLFNGVSLMFDPVSENEEWFTIDTTHFFMDEQLGGAKL
jgi:hypothetical protein